MRAKHLRPQSRLDIRRPKFRRELALAGTGGAHGYEVLGRAVGEMLAADRHNLLPQAALAAFDRARAVEDARSIVRLLVLRVPWLMRRVPRHRRYRSFEAGLRRGLGFEGVSDSGGHMVALARDLNP